MEWTRNPIFAGLSAADCRELERCTRKAAFSKGSFLFTAGTPIHQLGILLAGKILIESTDLWGNRRILHALAPGQVFAESFAVCRRPITVDVAAAEDSTVLFLDLDALEQQYSRREWYSRLLSNLLKMTAEKNLAWSGRMFCISHRHIRSRVMHYLSDQAVQQGSREFTIPFDRQQLADYLHVERSALSKELGKMQREGILTFHKNRFHLLQGE